MHIDKIKESLAGQINCARQWAGKLDDCNPGHYGVEDFDVEAAGNDIWVDIPKRSFTFSNVLFSFEVQLGGSNDQDGFSGAFSKSAKGHGAFKFDGNNEIVIESLEVEVDLDLFAS